MRGKVGCRRLLMALEGGFQVVESVRTILAVLQSSSTRRIIDMFLSFRPQLLAYAFALGT